MILQYHTHLPEAVFFDRDGTLIADTHYVTSPDQVILRPGIANLLATLRYHNILCFIVTNQSGVGRGYLTYYEACRIQKRLDWLLWCSGKGLIHHVFMCPHLPSDQCQCRKPNPYFLNHACLAYGLNARRCWMVGDKKSDIEAGKRAGMKTLLVPTFKGAKEGDSKIQLDRVITS